MATWTKRSLRLAVGRQSARRVDALQDRSARITGKAVATVARLRFINGWITSAIWYQATTTLRRLAATKPDAKVDIVDCLAVVDYRPLRVRTALPRSGQNVFNVDVHSSVRQCKMALNPPLVEVK